MEESRLDMSARTIAASASPLLRVSNISVRFGGIVALDDLSFDIARGQIVGLIGPNGAGKTTLFNCLSRLYPFDGGDIVFEGTSLRTVPRHGIAAIGIGRVIYTDVARDGMLNGVNVEATCEIARASGLPITASGGVSSLEDIRHVSRANCGIDSLIVGKALYEGYFTIQEALSAGNQ